VCDTACIHNHLIGEKALLPGGMAVAQSQAWLREVAALLVGCYGESLGPMGRRPNLGPQLAVRLRHLKPVAPACDLPAFLGALALLGLRPTHSPRRKLSTIASTPLAHSHSCVEWHIQRGDTLPLMQLGPECRLRRISRMMNLSLHL
jgi:hypothetical protein